MMASSSSSLIAASFSLVLLFVIASSHPSVGGIATAVSTSAANATTGMGGCSPDDIVVVQNATPPLPNGIPTYTAQVLNECVGGGSKCNIGDIHLSCGFFSSARLINPKTFRRIAPNDCLVNDGRPIAGGQLVTFQYANTFSYPLSVSSATCM